MEENKNELGTKVLIKSLQKKGTVVESTQFPYGRIPADWPLVEIENYEHPFRAAEYFDPNDLEIIPAKSKKQEIMEKLNGESKAVPTTREQVYHAINAERNYQDSLSPSRTDGSNKTVGEYLVMLQHYQSEAVKSWTINPGTDPALDNIRKIAAIAVRCMEEHGIIERKIK